MAEDHADRERALLDNETTPLLPSQTSERPASIQEDVHTASKPWAPPGRVPRWLGIVVLVSLIEFIFKCGSTLFDDALFRVLEATICERYFSDHPSSFAGGFDSQIPEAWCKVDAVQDQLATLLGWMQFWENLSLLFLAIPYGFLMDRYGRKPFLILSLLGQTLGAMWIVLIIWRDNGPLSHIWWSALFLALGGGETMMVTYTVTILSDVVPADVRSTIFSVFGCSLYFAVFITPILTSLLMRLGPWVPILTGIGCCLFGTLATFALPETLVRKSQASRHEGADAEEQVVQQSALHRGRAWLSGAASSLAVVLQDHTIVVVLLAFFFSVLGSQEQLLIVQYASKAFSWPFSKALYLISVYCAASVALRMLILPLCATWVLDRLAGGVAMTRDRYLAQASLVISIVGPLLPFFFNGEVVYTIGVVIMGLGVGYQPTLRSFAVSQVQLDTHESGTDLGILNALITVVIGIGSMVAGPAMAWTFHLGMSWGPGWLGFPFLCAACAFAVSSLVLTLAPKRAVAEV